MKHVHFLALATVTLSFHLFAQHPDTSGDGWKLLFNGKDLTGWQAGSTSCDGKTSSKEGGNGWVVKDGAMVRETKGGGYIWTRETYADFILDLEFNTTGNSGVFFRVGNIRNPVHTGMELQVLTHGDPSDKHGLGAIYDAVAPNKKVGKNGEWQHYTLSCVDNRITVILNGDKVTEMDLNKWDTARKNPDGSKNKFKTALGKLKREGHIGFQDHGAKVMYRNIKIKVLKKSL